MEISTAKPPTKRPNKTRLVVIGVVVLALVAVAGWLIFGSKQNKQSVTTNTKTNSAETIDEGYKQTEEELDEYKQEATVMLTADGPLPQTLNIPNDTRINWLNRDTKTHQLVLSADSNNLDKFYTNRNVEPANGYLFAVHQTGTFHYYLADKPEITGTIIVK